MLLLATLRYIFIQKKLFSWSNWPCYGIVLSNFSSTDPDNIIDDRSDDEDDFGVDVEGDDTDIDLGPDGTYN